MAVKGLTKTSFPLRGLWVHWVSSSWLVYKPQLQLYSHIRHGGPCCTLREPIPPSESTGNTADLYNFEGTTSEVSKPIEQTSKNKKQKDFKDFCIKLTFFVLMLQSVLFSLCNWLARYAWRVLALLKVKHQTCRSWRQANYDTCLAMFSTFKPTNRQSQNLVSRIDAHST